MTKEDSLIVNYNHSIWVPEGFNLKKGLAKCDSFSGQYRVQFSGKYNQFKGLTFCYSKDFLGICKQYIPDFEEHTLGTNTINVNSDNSCCKVSSTRGVESIFFNKDDNKFYDIIFEKKFLDILEKTKPVILDNLENILKNRKIADFHKIKNYNCCMFFLIRMQREICILLMET